MSLNEEGIFENISLMVVNMNNGTKKVVNMKISLLYIYKVKVKECFISLMKSLEEVQNDFTKTNEEVLEVSRRLKEMYQDKKQYWEQKSKTIWHTCDDRKQNSILLCKKKQKFIFLTKPKIHYSTKTVKMYFNQYRKTNFR